MSGSEAPVSRQLRDKLRKDRIDIHTNRKVRTEEEWNWRQYHDWRWKRLYNGQMRSAKEISQKRTHEDHVILHTQHARPHLKKKVSLPKLKFLEAADVP